MEITMLLSCIVLKRSRLRAIRPCAVLFNIYAKRRTQPCVVDFYCRRRDNARTAYYSLTGCSRDRIDDATYML